MTQLHPGSDLAGYRIEAVERDDEGAAVFLATDPHEDRIVALHVAREPLGALSTVRFLERARRIGGVVHPNLLDVYGARTLDGRAVAVAEAPPGRRLDVVLAGGPLASVPAVRIARQVASAVDALEDCGAEPPPLSARRIWVDGAGDAHLDGLDGSGELTSPRAASSSAAVAGLLEAMTRDVSRPLRAVLARALDGAYLSAGQLAAELRRIEACAAARRRRIAIAVAVVAALAVAALAVVLNG